MAENKKGLSRRDFLKTTGIATGAFVGGSLIGGVVFPIQVRLNKDIPV